MADESDDDPQLKSLRAVWLEMRDEAPPTRGLDALMAAARTQASALATPPWWKRMFDQLRRPSVLAFASLVLLVGGAVVLTRHDDAIEKAQPTTVPIREVETPAANQDTLHETIAPTAPVPAGIKKPERPFHQEPRTATPPRAHPDVPVAPHATLHGQGGEAAFEHPAPPPPPPPPPPDKAAAEALGKDDSSATRGPTEVLADQLATQMRSAAARGDCENAKAIAARIARQDPAYYRERVAAEISKCGAAAPKAAADLAH
ncbi:MAG: hypothetical protein ABI678_01430 [Kofleriaceae bacterium]